MATTIEIPDRSMKLCAMRGGTPNEFFQCCIHRLADGDDDPDDANHHTEKIPPDIEQMRQRDMANCLKFPGGGARVSVSTAFCVIWNTDDTTNAGSPRVDAYATENQGIPYITFCNGDLCSNAQSTSWLLMKDVTGNANMYVMPWAYTWAKQDCERNGGKLDLEIGTKHRNAYIYCQITGTPNDVTREKCDALQIPWSLGYIDENMGGWHISERTNGTPTQATCRYIPRFFYYTARDIPGTCRDNMIEDPETGHCMCKYGYNGEFRNSPCREHPENPE